MAPLLLPWLEVEVVMVFSRCHLAMKFFGQVWLSIGLVVFFDALPVRYILKSWHAPNLTLEVFLALRPPSAARSSALAPTLCQRCLLAGTPGPAETPKILFELQLPHPAIFLSSIASSKSAVAKTFK